MNYLARRPCPTCPPGWAKCWLAPAGQRLNVWVPLSDEEAAVAALAGEMVLPTHEIPRDFYAPETPDVCLYARRQ